MTDKPPTRRTLPPGTPADKIDGILAELRDALADLVDDAQALRNACTVALDDRTQPLPTMLAAAQLTGAAGSVLAMVAMAEALSGFAGLNAAVATVNVEVPGAVTDEDLDRIAVTIDPAATLARELLAWRQLRKGRA